MDKYLGKMKSTGFRLTKVRQAVLAYLERVQEPQTATAIFHGLGEPHDLASVYRTIELFETLGIAAREQQGKLAAYVLADRHHHHIVCRSCDAHTCLPCEVSVRAPNGFSAVHHQVMLTGVCATCAGK